MKTIFGKVPSKSNCYQIINIRGRGSLAKSKALKEYEKSFYIQCAERNRMLEGWLEFEVKVYYPSNRSDLDNSLKIILDCLQSCKVIQNDNKVVRILAEKYVDKDNPRIEYEINSVEL